MPCCGSSTFLIPSPSLRSFDQKPTPPLENHRSAATCRGDFAMVSIEGPMTGRAKNMAEHLSSSVRTVQASRYLSVQRYLHLARMLLHQASGAGRGGASRDVPAVDVSGDRCTGSQNTLCVCSGHKVRAGGQQGAAVRDAAALRQVSSVGSAR